MKKLSDSRYRAYQDEYEKQIMGKLNCRIKWGLVNEIASDAHNHLITSEDVASVSGILRLTDIADSTAKHDYQEKDVLNNQFIPESIHDRFATLENNFWILDVTMRIPVRDTQGTVLNKAEIGWVSQSVGDADGNFTAGSEPVLTIDFADAGEQTINLTGLLITFFKVGAEYATLADIVITRKDSTVVTVPIAPDTYSYEASFGDVGGSGVLDISGIQLVVKQWSKPNRRARIDEIEFGVYKFYDNTTLVDVEETRVINPVSSELPLSTLNITLLDNERLFDSENAGSLTAYLTQRQPIEVTWTQQTDEYVDENGETQNEVTVNGGIYYLKEWHDCDSRREYKLVAEDLIGFTEEPYYKGEYTANGQPVGSVISALFDELFPSGSGLSGCLDIQALDSIEGGCVLKGPLPLKLNDEQCTYKDCFMLLAQLTGCTIATDDEGKIVFKKLPESYADEQATDDAGNVKARFKIPLSVVFDNPPRGNLKSQLKEVRTNYYSYTLSSASTEDLFELYKGKIMLETNKKYVLEHNVGGETLYILVNGNDKTLQFEKKSYAYVTFLTYLGMESGEVEITLQGNELKNASAIYTKLPEQTSTSGEVVTIDTPICCTEAQADAIAQRFIAETEERDEFEIEIKRNMLLECGDIVELEKPTWDGSSIVNLPCRVLESKKNLTKVRHKVRLRKLSVS